MVSSDGKIAVVGSGSWGTALANALSHKGLKVTIWSRRSMLAESIQQKHENSEYLPGVFLSPRLRATADLEAAIEGAEVIVMAVPAQGFRDTLRAVARFAEADAPIVSLAKGLEAETLCRMSEVIAQEIPASWPKRICALSGPNLAKEIALGHPAASVIACADTEIADELQALFMTPVFRTYSDSDVVGVELGGAIKNVIAIATGISEGCGFGDNARATVMTRGLAEMTRLGVSLGADRRTFAGLAGVGDLICTCISGLSRNHHVGVELGRGAAMDSILKGMKEIAEGVESSKAVKEIAERQGIDMPICQGVYRVIHENQEISEMVADLLRTVRQRERD
ncbi:MAG: NAD(P)H-dependent glycerol-3-phosphate dehydrogenase [Actinomycetota bacterium]